MAAVLVALLAHAAPAGAAFTIFTDRASFDAATNSRVIEDFENARLPPVDPNFPNGPKVDDTVLGPIDQTTTNVGENTNVDIFEPGGIIPNLRISAVGPAPLSFFVNNDNLVPGTTVLTTNNADNFARLDFYQAPITAFAVDLGTKNAAIDPGGLFGFYEVRIYGPGNALLGTELVTFPIDQNTGEPVDPTVFLGFTSTDLVTRVELDTPLNETFDNVTLGQSNAIPAPGGLVLLAAAAPVAAWVRRRR